MGTRRWGMVLAAAALLAAGLLAGPITAAGAGAAREHPLLLPIAAQTPMEAQMMGDKPFQTRTPALGPGAFRIGGEGAKVGLPFNLELGISFRYHHDPASVASPGPQSSYLVNYSVDYRLLPNLNVGFQGYLYRYDSREGPFHRSGGDRAMGLGPSLKYDLGQWSFILKSQVETNRERGEGGLQNWFRVWYAF